MTGFKQKKILVINANSSCSVTKGLKDELSAPTKLFNVSIEYTQIDGAPKAIETTEDVELSHKLTIAFVKKAKADAPPVIKRARPRRYALGAKANNKVPSVQIVIVQSKIFLAPK